MVTIFLGHPQRFQAESLHFIRELFPNGSMLANSSTIGGLPAAAVVGLFRATPPPMTESKCPEMSAIKNVQQRRSRGMHAGAFVQGDAADVLALKGRG